MAKRFTDTEIWRQAWFRRLPVHMKCAWRYLCETCNCAGIWSEDYDQMSYLVGCDITSEELLTYLGERLMRVADDKLLILKFIPFQYGQLKHSCKPHRAVIRELERYPKLNEILTMYFLPLSKGIGTGPRNVKDKEKEKDKERAKGVPDDVISEWKKSCEHYSKKVVLARDEVSIYRAFQRVRSWDRVKKAIIGFRREPSSGDYKAEIHFYAGRLEKPDSFNYLESLGESDGVRSNSFDLDAAIEEQKARDAKWGLKTPQIAKTGDAP